MFGNWKDHIQSTLSTFLVFIFSAVIDFIYIILVVLFNVGIDACVGLLKPKGLTYWTFTLTQILLAALSLGNILIYVYSDMRIAIIRSKRMIDSIQAKIEE